LQNESKEVLLLEHRTLKSTFLGAIFSLFNVLMSHFAKSLATDLKVSVKLVSWSLVSVHLSMYLQNDIIPGLYPKKGCEV